MTRVKILKDYDCSNLEYDINDFLQECNAARYIVLDIKYVSNKYEYSAMIIYTKEETK